MKNQQLRYHVSFAQTFESLEPSGTMAMACPACRPHAPCCARAITRLLGSRSEGAWQRRGSRCPGVRAPPNALGETETEGDREPQTGRKRRAGKSP